MMQQQDRTSARAPITGEPRRAAKPDWRGFPLQILLVAILPISLLVLAVVFGSQALHHQAMRNMVGERDLRAAQIAGSAISQQVHSQREIFEQISYRIKSSLTSPFSEMREERSFQTFERGLALLSLNGNLIDTSGSPEEWARILDAFFSATPPAEWANGEISVATLVVRDVAAAGGSDYFVIYSLLIDSETVLMGAESVSALVENIRVKESGMGEDLGIYALGVDQHGQVTLLTPAGDLPDRFLTENQALIQAALQGSRQTRYDDTPAGERVTVFAPADPPGWVVVFQENWENAAGPDLLSTQFGPLVMVPLFLLAVLLVWFGVRRIVLPLQKLEDEAGELAEGDFQAIREPVGGILEIRSLQNTMLEMAGRLETAQENLHSYIGAVTASVESERKSLARELHDDTIQALIALNQRIQLILTRAGESEKSQLLELQGLTQDTIDNLRRMIRGLRPIYLEDLGLAASIEMLAREASHAGSIRIEFWLQGEERRLDPQAEIAIYRIAQESLSNILHHSRATQAWVALAYNGGHFTVQIRDNGQGFNLFENQTDIAEKGHFGLLGMRERAELIGAEFEVVSAPGQGTTILLSMK